MRTCCGRADADEPVDALGADALGAAVAEGVAVPASGAAIPCEGLIVRIEGGTTLGPEAAAIFIPKVGGAASIFDMASASCKARSSSAAALRARLFGGGGAAAASWGCSSSRCTARATSPWALCSATAACSSVKPMLWSSDNDERDIRCCCLARSATQKLGKGENRSGRSRCVGSSLQREDCFFRLVFSTEKPSGHLTLNSTARREHVMSMIDKVPPLRRSP